MSTTIRKSLNFVIDEDLMSKLIIAHIESLNVEIEGVSPDCFHVEFKDDENWEDISVSASVSAYVSVEVS